MDDLDRPVSDTSRRTRPLVGRKAELKLIDDALTRSMDSQRLVEVVGDPGIGKTRLLTEFTRHVTSRRVLRGRAAERERDVPFAPVIDALDDQVDRKLVAGLTEGEIQLLGNVFPELTDRAVTSTVRSRLYRAVRALLRELAGTTGLVMVLDDMHWADETTVELIDYLVRHPLPAPVLLIVAYRPAQVPLRLASALADAPSGHVQRVQIEPLTLADVHELLGSGLSRASRERRYEASEGIPLYLDEPAARAALAAELEGLDKNAALVARSAAVVGDEFEPALVATVAQMPEHAVLTAFDELVARDVVRAIGGRFRFRHALVREVAYDSAAAGWRHGAHTRIADHLKQVSAPAVVRAEHVVLSAKYGDQSAVDTLVAAARTVATHNPQLAAGWYDTALSLLIGNDDLRIRLSGEMALCEGASGQFTRARETFRSALRALPTGNQAERAMSASFCAMLDYLVGEYRSAKLLLRTELARQADPESASAAPLRLQLATISLLRSELDVAEAVLDGSPDDDRDRWTAPFTALRACTLVLGGRRAEAAPLMARAAALIDTCDNEEFLVWLPQIALLCWTELLTAQQAAGLRHIAKAVELARASGHRYILPQLLHLLAYAHAGAGRIADGLAAVEEALELMSELGVDALPRRGLLLSVWCQLTSWRGQHEAAVNAGREAIATVDREQPMTASLAHSQLLLAQVNAGDHQAAVQEILAAAGGAELPAVDSAIRLQCYCLMARAEAARGEAEPAQRWAGFGRKHAEPEVDSDRLYLSLAEAYAASVDEPGRAVGLALTAAEAAEAAGLVLFEACARLLAGTCLARCGTRDRALVQLQHAATIFNVCEAAELHAVAVREQRRLGVRVPTTGGNQSAQALSPREQDVAELVCAGSTNQQIAEKLVLSVRTVETHLTHIFAKLGVTNRAGVARVLASQSDD